MAARRTAGGRNTIFPYLPLPVSFKRLLGVPPLLARLSIRNGMAHPGRDPGRDVCREVVGDLPECPLLYPAANSVGYLLRLGVPPRMHFEVVARGDGSEVHASFILVPIQHNRPSVEPRFDTTAGRVEKDDPVARFGTTSRCLSPDRPSPALVLPDIQSIAVRRPLPLIHLINPHRHSRTRSRRTRLRH